MFAIVSSPRSSSGLGPWLAAALVAASLGCGGEEDEHAAHAAHGATEPTPLPETSPDARVFFVSPSDGATVVGELVDGKVSVHVEMGAEQLRVMPAGELADGAGHHHIIIDGDPVPRGEAVPANESHIHYGRGQTEADLQLSAGPHTLRLQFADGAHRSYGSALSTLIHVNVAPTNPAPAAAAPVADDTAAEADGADAE
ncbi:MAG: DUF4399 domain-containing protein [Myxococcales bacterium]|nr:DUF4399 domain-containing protein [Myxococcales bacterium]